MSFNERFTDPKKEKFIAHDNITIGIERNIQGNYPAVIPESIDTSAVIVFRKRDDGDKPLCKRPEFRNDIDADDEKLELLNPSSTVASITHPVNNEWHNSRRENRYVVSKESFQMTFSQILSLLFFQKKILFRQSTEVSLRRFHYLF